MVALQGSLESFRALIDRSQVGLAWLDHEGAWLEWNDTVDVLIRGESAAVVRDAVKRLWSASAASGACVETTVDLMASHRLVISVAPDRTPKTFIVAFDRLTLERARTEASVLRGFVRAIAHSSSRDDAIRRALQSARSSLPLVHVAFFEPTPERRLRCSHSVGVSQAEFNGDRTVDLDTDGSVLATAWRYGRLLHVPDTAHGSGRAPFARTRSLSAVVVPVGVRRPKGLLYVSAQPGALSEGTLRVVESLAEALGAMLDVSALEAETVRAREVAAQQERLATIGQLVAGVAHEINNPLAFLKSNLHSLKYDVDELRQLARPELVAELDDIVSESIDGVSRIESIVLALKSTARQRHEHVQFDLGRAVSEAVTIFRGAKKAEVEIECDVEGLPTVCGSASAIGQVVLNLLQNGLDAMAEAPRGRRKLEVNGDVSGPWATVYVRDHGSGIPADVQERMFDAFFTTKENGKGTGLGLYICKDIIEGMGGTIRCETSKQGTVFELRLPVEAPTPSP